MSDLLDEASADGEATLKFDHNVIEHLGIKLYQNKAVNVLAEVVANSWDADARCVWIDLYAASDTDSMSFLAVTDNGCGMNYETIRDQYLVIGKPKRRSPKDHSAGGRPPMGRKGIGKLAPFGIARQVDVVTVVDPPKPVVSQILDMVGEWPFPPLRGIIQCPTLRRDGSLLDADGYDEKTGLALSKNLKMPPMPDRPTRDDAEASLAQLNRLLIEFPFVDETSRAVALSMMLTPVLRAAMEVAPMHAVTAPRAGTGKSFLADIVSMIATGERCPVKAQGRNPEETEKRLIGSALEGRPIIALDNCDRELEGDFLCQVTERPILDVRALGKSDPHIVANSFCVFANGNNLSVADDMVRRTIRCAMDANCENPETRTFKSSPMALIRANRGTYIAACLTIARAYLVAGRPNQLPPLPSFEDWSATVRDPLVWLGCRDPVATMDALRNEDPKTAERYAVFAAWKSALGVDKPRAALTPQIIEIAGRDADLCEVLRNVAPQRIGEGIDPKALGKWLSSQEKTIAAGCKLMIDSTNKLRPRWYLELQGK